MSPISSSRITQIIITIINIRMRRSRRTDAFRKISKIMRKIRVEVSIMTSISMRIRCSNTKSRNRGKTLVIMIIILIIMRIIVIKAIMRRRIRRQWETIIIITAKKCKANKNFTMKLLSMKNRCFQIKI
jgi:hypothetical protein